VLCTWDHVPGSAKIINEIMVDMLSSLLDVSSISVMGTLNKAFQWHVTFNDYITANNLVLVG
jgi:hypothetical protein